MPIFELDAKSLVPIRRQAIGAGVSSSTTCRSKFLKLPSTWTWADDAFWMSSGRPGRSRSAPQSERQVPPERTSR